MAHSQKDKKNDNDKDFKALSWHRIANSFSALIVLALVLIFGAKFYGDRGMSVNPADPTNPAFALSVVSVIFVIVSMIFAIWRFSMISGKMMYNTFKLKNYNVFGKIFMPIISIAMALFAVLAIITSLGFLATMIMELVNNPEGVELTTSGRWIKLWINMGNAETGAGAFLLINAIANALFVIGGMIYIFIGWISKKRKPKDENKNKQAEINQQNPNQVGL